MIDLYLADGPFETSLTDGAYHQHHEQSSAGREAASAWRASASTGLTKGLDFRRGRRQRTSDLYGGHRPRPSGAYPCASSPYKSRGANGLSILCALPCNHVFRVCTLLELTTSSYKGQISIALLTLAKVNQSSLRFLVNGKHYSDCDSVLRNGKS